MFRSTLCSRGAWFPQNFRIFGVQGLCQVPGRLGDEGEGEDLEVNPTLVSVGCLEAARSFLARPARRV